ncbi:cytochrome P450 family protein [Streptomyces pinistramenti]|uniref:cytochrome P450 family protein n=1 Tax=Streptomyces pinistramenti TaxID=2884812 RepID=UPI001D07566A|nr:cytochrome P450 [Streptomyces pinistramenti]MCB5908971.1 cytochrome P450 [Streptomyces pinistramenti]
MRPNANSPMDSAEFSRNPYPTLAALRRRGPVQRVRASEGRTTWIVTGWPEARAALADARLSKDTGRYFADRPSARNLAPAVSRTMLATDPPDHGRLRRLAMTAFTPAAVARIEPRIHEIAQQLARHMRARDASRPTGPDAAGPGCTDLVEEFAAPLPIAVISELLGVPEGDRTAVRHWSHDLFAAAAPDTVDRASHAISDYMTELIAQRRAAPGDDLLSALIAARDAQDRLTEPELVSLAVLLVVAGHETTTHLISNGMLVLLHDDALRARLRADATLLPAAVEEFLRHDSPVTTATFRYATVPFTLGGVRIAAGDVVLVSPGAANRDPARFAEPDAVRPGRATGHLAFGHGPHHCLGAPLARVEARIAFGVLLDRFPGMRPAGTLDDVTWRRTRLMRGPARLPVALGPDVGPAIPERRDSGR